MYTYYYPPWLSRTGYLVKCQLETNRANGDANTPKSTQGEHARRSMKERRKGLGLLETVSGVCGGGGGLWLMYSVSTPHTS